jgi:HlyD family secretion protein
MAGRKLVFVLAAAGIGAGIASAHLQGARPEPEPPLFSPAPNPFEDGVYATGIVESYQAHGQNTNLYPEVSGVVTEIRAEEGQAVARGDVLVVIDDSVQRATTAQLRAQAEAARALLDELRAQPLREVLLVSRAQVELAAANLETAQVALAKQKRSHDLDPRSVSKDALDAAVNAARVAEASLAVATRQHQLTQAGAWRYEIENQERLYQSARKAHRSARALLTKYRIKAPRDGVVLSVQAAVGSYVSPQGVYSTYTQSHDPIAVMADAGRLAVRCYLDEILIPRIPEPSRLEARMFIRGTDTSVALEFVRVQPYVSLKIQLSNQRTEKVDLRVLPLVFRFSAPEGTTVYPGQLVDVYLSQPRPVAEPQAEAAP